MLFFFWVLKMKKQKTFKISLLIIILLFTILIFGSIYIKDNILISEYKELNYIASLSDIIGNINIDKINLNEPLLQGLNNEYYYNHNFLGQENTNGELVLDTYGDIENNNNNIIYTTKEKFKDFFLLQQKDIIKILYIKDQYCFQIKEITPKNKKTNDLIIKIKDTTNIYTKKIKC